MVTREEYRTFLDKEIRRLLPDLAKAPKWTTPEHLSNVQAACKKASELIYVPTTYPDISDLMIRLVMDGDIPGLKNKGFEQLCNLVILRRALMVEPLVRNAKAALSQLYERTKLQTKKEREDNIIRFRFIAGLMAGHSTVLGLMDPSLVQKAHLQGDPFHDGVEFARSVELALLKYERDGNFGETPTTASVRVPLIEGNPWVEQAFKRILSDIINSAAAEGFRQALAARCEALKLAFPEQGKLIDKLFRQEIESLDKR